MERTSYFSMLACSIIVLAYVVSLIPLFTHAQAGAATANAQCVPADEKNGHPCQLRVSGGTQMGICTGGICKGTGSTPGKGAAEEGVGGGGVNSGFVENFLKGIMDKLMQGGGGGGGGGGAQSGTNDQNGRTGVSGDLLDSVSNISASSTGTILNNSTAGILESFTNTQTPQTQVNDTTNNSVGSLLSNFIQGFTQSNTATNTTANINTQNTNSGTAATQTPNAWSNLQGDVTENNEGVTIVNAGIDATTNTGVAGFFGLFRSHSENQTQPGQTLFGRLCIAKPWEASLITRIFSARFFDSLCERRLQNAQQSTATLGTPAVTTGQVSLRCTSSIKPGGSASISWSCPDSSRSSGIGFETEGEPDGSATVIPAQTTQYTLQCARGGSRSCVVQVAAPRVELVAYPDRVDLGTRTRLYWASDGVKTCTLTGPGLNETGVRGAVTTSTILDTTTFSVECVGDGGVKATDFVTINVGP